MPTVLITGAAAGIGHAAARLFAANGWRCQLADRDTGRLAALVDSLVRTTGRDHMALPVDLADTDGLAALATPGLTLDAVINNAGISDAGGLPLTTLSWEQCRPLLDLNLKAPVAVVRAVKSQLAPGARIVNVASGAAFGAIPLRGLYSATKAGLVAQSRALAAELPQACISVVAPGFIRTDLVQSLIDAGRLDPARAVAKIPLGRLGTPEDIAHGMLWLAGRHAHTLQTGMLRIDGGSGIYGGSTAFAPAVHPAPPCDSTTEITIAGDAEPALVHDIHQHTANGIPVDTAVSHTTHASSYPAVIDVTPWQCAPHNLLQTMHHAATRFAKNARSPAGLTLVLPSASSPPGNADDAGYVAAAHMLVATLACELAPAGHRVNAVSVPAQYDSAAAAALLQYIAGARARFMTGQCLSLHSVQGK